MELNCRWMPAFAVLLIFSCLQLAVAQAGESQLRQEKAKVIFDQDTEGIVGDNEDPLIMLLQSPRVDVLGVTVVTGNGWVKQETADVLKLLELEGRADIPVYMGPDYPLVQSRYELVRLTKLYGGSRTDPFLGAFGEFSPGPDDVVAPPGGYAKIKAQPEPAAEFIIKSIRANPHQVTLYCGGSLTNIALAISLDPGIVPLTKEIVFMGTSPEYQPKTVNVLYDVYAARLVLHAAWPKLTIVTVDVAEKVHKTPEMAETIAKGNNQAEAALYTELVVKPYRAGKPVQWFRMPDELMAAYIIDPSIIKETRRYYVDVDINEGMNFGASMYWDEHIVGYGGVPWPDGPVPRIQKPVPPPDARVANVIWDFDVERFKAIFLNTMTRPMRKQ
ncbi:MAG: nucleoside hydrolase [Acidobacteriaceae bacterium]|nr:nucleoside hydrolase [Acidobacteriaceae bacterium]